MLNWVRNNVRTMLFITAGALMLFFVFGSGDALAQVEGLAAVGAETGLGTEDPRIVIARLVRTSLGFLGVIGVVLVMYGGFLWMTSKGDTTKIEKAKAVLINAAIGTGIILSALMITQFIINSLVSATIGSSVNDNAAPEIITPLSLPLGNGILDSHYPPRNASGIARNTNIVVSFREPIFPGSIMDGYEAGDDPSVAGVLDIDAVQIYETDKGVDHALTDVAVAFSADRKSVVFNPGSNLGNASSNVSYTVKLTDQITLDDSDSSGDSVFVGRFADGYAWSFTTSTIVDSTPPTVRNVVPMKDTENPRNILLTINYSEAINPVTASGFYPDASSTPDFVNIRAEDSNGFVDGEWKLVNQFKSSEFVPSQTCGTNSCGEAVYCLPPNEGIKATIQAPNVGDEPPAAVLSPNGITDMAGNAFDGNANGDAEGPVVDDYLWEFTTTGELRLDAPIISTITPSIVTPGVAASNIDFDQPVMIKFNSLMQLSTISADSIVLHSPSDDLWFSFDTDTVDNVAQTTINHGIFSADKLYGAEVKSLLKSVYQNCFIPSHSETCTDAVNKNCCNEESSSAECLYPTYTY